MELFAFFRGLFAWMVTVALLFPVNVVFAALAYKVRNGPKELEIDSDEMWIRSGWAAFMFGLVTLGFVFLDWFFVDSLAFPAGIIHLVMVAGYIPAGAWIMTYYFGFSDLLDGLSTFTLYIALPLIVLYLVDAVTGLWSKGPIAWVYSVVLPIEPV
ncbi:MAG: hypothetical protein U0793_16255 [Gemmataceae bacterium]|mgnify:CR=1 FL=1